MKGKICLSSFLLFLLCHHPLALKEMETLPKKISWYLTFCSPLRGKQIKAQILLTQVWVKVVFRFF